MKFNDLTYRLAIVTLIIYTVYSFGSMGMVGILITSALILIATSLVDNIEYVAVAVVVSGLIYSYVAKMYITKNISPQNEGFTDGSNNSGQISQRIQKMSSAYAKKSPVGVYDPMIEGFADAGSSDTRDSDSSDEEKGENPSSKPAPRKMGGDNEVDAKEVMDILSGGTTGNAKKTNTGTEEDSDSPADIMKNVAESIKESFNSGSSSDGLFKLGELPSETSTGPHVDASSTLMKAMNALKPEQVSAMTADTKKLMDTQKGLMSMLQNMRPVLEDGRQLLDTFSNIFGGGGNNGNGKPFKLGN